MAFKPIAISTFVVTAVDAKYCVSTLKSTQ